MALGECFPTELINTLNLKIERVSFSDDYGDEIPSTRVIIGENLPAIVVPCRRVFIRVVDSESDTQLSDVVMSPLVAPADIRQKDLVTWTPRTFGPQVVDAEVEEIEYISGVDGLESVVLKVGRRVV